ncbi:MAG: quinone-dependent dihydroorotate dehydrogenase [Acetobacteraceae bacterium]
MSPIIASTLLPLLQWMGPERAHRIALAALRAGLAGRDRSENNPMLAVEALGLRFRNPIGLAAGFDKDAVAVRPLAHLGFGFVETGTVTPRPQPGNPKPRMFRLPADRAVINRMGFNNAGIAGYAERLRRPHPAGIPIGANIGINKDGADPERDYPALLAAVAPLVQYAVINVSSPNTPGLRDLQNEARLRAILAAVNREVPNRPPLLVKIAPDLSRDSLANLIETCAQARIQGLIISNTTTTRPPDLAGPAAQEAGGLSGAPLLHLSTAVLARAHLISRGRLSLIGVGGIFSGQDALMKIQAGAALVQVYTSFAYHGPMLLPRLKSELAEALKRAGFARLQDAVGTAAERLAGDF